MLNSPAYCVYSLCTECIWGICMSNVECFPGVFSPRNVLAVMARNVFTVVECLHSPANRAITKVVLF